MKAIRYRTLSVREKIEVSAIARTLNLDKLKLKKQCEILRPFDANNYLTKIYEKYIENDEQCLICYAEEIRHYEDVYRDFQK